MYSCIRVTNLKSKLQTFIQIENTEKSTNAIEYTSQLYESLELFNVKSYQNIREHMY